MTQDKIDLDKGGIDVLRAIIKLPRRPAWANTAEARAQLAEEEAVLQDDLVAYAYAYASMDLEGLMEHFIDDVVIVNPSGTFSGSDHVRRNYEYLFKDWPNARHIWGDVGVRFLAPDEAYRTSMIYETHATKQWWGTSTDIQHLKKLNGRWKIIRRCIAPDGSFKAERFEEDIEKDRKALLAELQKAKR